MNAINRAMDRLNGQIVLADCLAQSFEDLAGDATPPPWVHVFACHIDAIREASEALESHLRGYGGDTPHGDTQTAPPSPPSRAMPDPAQDVAARPEKQSSLVSE